MDIFLNGKKLSCRQCGSQMFTRIHRRGWEKFIPHSKLYRCEKCQEACLVLTGHEHLESVKST